MSFLFDAVADALSWALSPKSTWGFVVRAGFLILAIAAFVQLR